MAGIDYGRVNMALLTFPRCQRRACRNIAIYDDDRVDRQRDQFYVSLHPYRTSPAGLRVNSRALVDILDNDGM